MMLGPTFDARGSSPSRGSGQESLPVWRYRFGELVFDQALGELIIRGQLVEVEPLPLAVLALLLSRPRQLVDKQEILSTVWGDRPTVDNVVANAITKLRAAFGLDYRHLIVNVPRQGYRLDADVTREVVSDRGRWAEPFVSGTRVPGRQGYVLHEQLGDAGRADVWRAVDRTTRQCRVFKFALTDERLMALRREFSLHRVLHEALGERPDLCRVLGARLDEPPYHLELADGGDDMLRWADAGHLSGLDNAGRLDILCRAAEAVAAAHDVGVLHKDLKPSNLLLRRAGEPDAAGADAGWAVQVIDFGAGRLIDRAVLERLGVTARGFERSQALDSDVGIGTLMYVAPEVIGGQTPTVRSDLYALGVLLYQLLAGDLRRPMAPGWESDVDDPLLRDDIARATQGRPGARPASVADWVAGLRRLPQRRAEQVRQAQAQADAERRAASAARARALRPWWVALAASLLVGAAVSAVQWQAARTERDQAAQAREQADRVLAFLRDEVLLGANPYAGRYMQPQTVVQALVDAQTSVAARFEGLPATEAAVRSAMAQLLAAHERLDEAAQQWALAAAAAERAGAPALALRIEALYGQASALARGGRADAAQAALAQAQQVHAGRPGADSAWPQRLAVVRELAIASAGMNAYKVETALPHQQRALDLVQGLQPPDGRLWDAAHAELITAYSNVGRDADAIALARRWLSHVEQRDGPQTPTALFARARLGEVLANDNRGDEAASLLDAVIPALTRLLGPGAIPTVRARNSRCEVDGAAKRWDAAADCLAAHLADVQGVSGVPPRFLMIMRLNIGIHRAAAGRWQEADRVFADLLPLAPRHPELQGVFVMAAYYGVHARLRAGRPAEARAMLAAVDVSRAAQADPMRPWQARALALEGLIAERLGALDEARSRLDSALSAYEKFAGERKITRVSEQIYRDLHNARLRLGLPVSSRLEIPADP